MTKTNAIRLIERAGIAHELRSYEISMEEFSAEAVAELIGLPADQVFKTLVATGPDGGAVFAVIPADASLDLKALAKAAGARSMSLVSVREVEPLTGYRRGGVTAIGARRELPVFLEEAAVLSDTIAVSAGLKGLQVVLATDDYIALTGATVADITTRAGP